MILQNAPVETHLMTPDEAIAKGALALFGEKYGDEVRVVSMGIDARRAQGRACLFGRALRRHACAAHRRYRPAQDRGESAVASGVRRVEALTGEAARAYLATQDARVREAAELLKVSPDEMIERLAAILDERRKLERQLADAKRELALGGRCGARRHLVRIRELGTVKLLARTRAGRGAEGPARPRR